MRKQRKQGFTLLEGLLIIVIIGILMALGIPNYQSWRASTITNQAAEQFARDIDRQRSEAKRRNIDVRISVAAEGTSYRLAEIDRATGNELSARTVSLPGGTTIRPSSTTTSFFVAGAQGIATTDRSTLAPIDRVPFEVRWTANGSIKKSVSTIGVLGKVIIQ